MLTCMTLSIKKKFLFDFMLILRCAIVQYLVIVISIVNDVLQISL